MHYYQLAFEIQPFHGKREAEDKGTFREGASESSDFLVAFDTYMVLLLKPGASAGSALSLGSKDRR